MDALRQAFQHLYDNTDPMSLLSSDHLGHLRHHEWRASREEAEVLIRAVLQTNTLIEVVVELQIVKMCNAEGLDSSRIIPTRRNPNRPVALSPAMPPPPPSIPSLSFSATHPRPGRDRMTHQSDHDPWHTFSYTDHDCDSRLLELRDVYVQAMDIMRFLVFLNAKAGCQVRGLNSRVILGSSYGFADLDDVLLKSLSHTLFRIPLTANAMQALKAYPISLAKQLLHDLQTVKRGSFMPLLFSVLVVGGGRKTQAGHELGSSARAFVGYLVRQNGVCLHLVDPTLQEGQMLGAAKFDITQWNRRELAVFDAVVLLSRPASLDLTLLDEVDICILEEFD